MSPLDQNNLHLTRRHFFGKNATGIGAAALAGLLSREAAGEPVDERRRFGGLPTLPHFAPKAKRVIYLFQNGAPTHVDLFDWKPELKARHKEPVPL